MSSDIKDGGPAFPVASCPDSNGQICWGTDGMSLRDYFAGQVVGSLIATRSREASLHEVWAEYSYKMAEAMLKAREVKP